MNRLLTMFAQDYLAGKLPLERLQGLLVEIIWGEAGEVSQETLDLANEIDSRIAEFTSEHISEDELKGLIREAAGLNPFVVTAGPQALKAQAARWCSASRTQRQTLAFG